MHPRHDLPIERRRESSAGGRDAADDLWNVLDPEGWVPRVDALRRKRQEEIATDCGSVLLEQGEEQLLGRPGVCRALQDDQLPWTEVGGRFSGGADHVGNVRVLGLPQRRGDTDDDGVTVRQNRRLGDRPVAAAAQKGLQVGARHVWNVGPAAGQRCDPVGIGIEPGHREAGSRELNSERQTDVALTDDGHPRGVSLDAMAQRRGMVHTLPLRGFQEGAIQLDRDAPSKEVD